MVIKITCTCNSTFEIRDGFRHPSVITCPNCGHPLPDDATNDLLSALKSFSLFEAKLYDGQYEIEYLK